MKIDSHTDGLWKLCKVLCFKLLSERCNAESLNSVEREAEKIANYLFVCYKRFDGSERAIWELEDFARGFVNVYVLGIGYREGDDENDMGQD